MPDNIEWAADERSTESTFVAFTELWMGDRKWNVTLREGMNEERVLNLLDLLKFTAGKMDEVQREMRVTEASRTGEAGFEPREQGQPPRQPAEGQPQASERPYAQATEGTERCSRLLVEGTLEDPVVKLFSANPKLQFPFIYPKSSIVIDLLSRIGVETNDPKVQRLAQPGVSMNICWDVAWKQSPKNPKWKDILGIQIVPKD